MTASQLARSAFVFGLVTGAVAGAAEPMKADSALFANTCSVSVAGQRLTLASPAFAFMLDTSDGLQAVSWENRLTGKTLELGSGPEVEFDIGLPDKPVTTPKLRVARAPDAAKGATGEAVFELTSDEPAVTVTVTYRWDAKQPVLRKFVTIANTGKTEWDRLLNVRLGTYRTYAKLSGGELTVHPPSFRNRAHVFGGLQGFPVYAADEFFLSLAHPAGWSTQKPGEISLRHYPGTKLPPGGRRDCLEAVYGVGRQGGGREAFVSYVRSRMRRTVRGHDKPYGYCCSDGQRAILAINNATWEDRVLPLELNAVWGLPDGKTWDLYRWYPNPARLTAEGKTFGPEAKIPLRAFEVVLLEAVPHGETPALRRDFQQQSLPVRFAEPSQRLKVAVTQPATTQATLDAKNWKLLEIVEAKSTGGATLTPQPDGSILASGQSPSPDTYQVQAKTAATGITAILLETLPHDSLPGKGPGRAVNGNYQLSEVRVHAAPTDRSATPTSVTLHKPIADYAQASHGGWPIAAALDGDPKTAWSIDPAEGSPHVALCETAQPLGFTGGTALSFELLQGDREHTLGRFRLWVTNAVKPALPAGYGAPKWIVQGETPATDRGGLLVVVVELLENGQPVELANLGSLFTAEALVAGAPAAFRPALGPQGYPSSWQAWRLAVETRSAPCPFELRIVHSWPGKADRRFSAYFLPRED